MKNKYEYLINYMLRGGEGSRLLTISKPINCSKDIKDIISYLEKDSNLSNVGIRSYILVSKKVNRRKFIK